MTSRKYWTTANQYCQSLGAELASSTSSGTNDFLTTIASDEFTLIGGYKYNNTWKWTDGSTWSYENWADGRPRTDIKLKLHSGGRWYDDPHNHFGSHTTFICQQPEPGL